MSGGTVTVSNATVSGNSAMFGGGISIAEGTLTVSNSALAGNSASGVGGGIGVGGGTLAVSTTTLTDNSAGFGGGIFIGDGTLTLSASTLSGNSATNGGGIGVGGGILLVSDRIVGLAASSTPGGNTASAGGGGIAVSGGTVTVSNATVSGNSATQIGPGIALTAGANDSLAAPTLTSATLASGKLTVAGTLTGADITASTIYTVEFFANLPGPSPTAPATGADPEGKVYLGSTTVTTNSGGAATISATLVNLPAAFSAATPIITATTIAPNSDTSAFSAGVVDPGPAAQISSARAAAFTVDTMGNFLVTTTGFPVPTLTESGALPKGLTFNHATGVLSGAPAAGTSGVYTLHFTASNRVGSATQTFILTVDKLVTPVAVPTQITVTPPASSVLVSGLTNEYKETFTLTEDTGISLGGTITIMGFAGFRQLAERRQFRDFHLERVPVVHCWRPAFPLGERGPKIRA